MPEYQNFRSSLISGISHEGETLIVQFRNGQTYHYPKTPKPFYDLFMQAPSKGKFFHRFVKRYRKGILVKEKE